MLFKRLIVVSGLVAFVLAVIGANLFVNRASAGGDDKSPPRTENRDSGGPIFSKLGF